MLAVLNRDPSPRDEQILSPSRGRRAVTPPPPATRNRARDADAPNPVRATAAEVGDPRSVAAHLDAIVCSLALRDGQYESLRDHLAKQPDINAKMRGILVDWLVDVNLKFKLLPQTLFLSVALLDRYLAARQVLRQRLQLVGVTALMMAAKFEEVYPPQLKDYVAVCDNAYTRTELLSTEAEILAALNFEIARPTSYSFLELLRQRVVLEDKAFVFARYLLETALLDPLHLRHSPLDLAAAALFLVHKIFKRAWVAAPVEGLGPFDEGRVKLCAKDLFVLLNRHDAGALSAVKRKFAEEQYFEVSKYKIEKGPAQSSN